MPKQLRGRGGAKPKSRAKTGATRSRARPATLSARHEKFAQELVKGASASKAYRAAGYKGGRQHAARLMTNGLILARVAELKNIAAERATITTQRLIEE